VARWRFGYSPEMGCRFPLKKEDGGAVEPRMSSPKPGRRYLAMLLMLIGGPFWSDFGDWPVGFPEHDRVLCCRDFYF